MPIHRSFRELKDATFEPARPQASARSPARYGDSGKIIDANPGAAIEAYSMRDGQAIVGSGAHEPMDRPGRGVPRRDRQEDDRVKRGTGGRAKPADGPAWLEGINAGTQVQHNPGKLDQADVGRGRPITY